MTSELPVLRAPAGGTPGVTDTRSAFDHACRELAAGDGPVGVDTERAQSYRYSARAYLIQLKRRDTCTFLIDPLAFDDHDFRRLAEVLTPHEWIIHAASNDLSCLIDAGLAPTRIFDTELAGRLLGLPKVGLGAMVEHYLGVSLLKEHSRADWSTRPLDPAWLTYAALDVELLDELRDRVADDLAAAGRTEWASQEFDHVLQCAHQPVDTTDPWRHTSGLHGVRTRRGLGLVREMWLARDAIAREIDHAPGQVLSDKAISEFAGQIKRDGSPMPDASTMRDIEGFRRRRARRYQDAWLGAIRRAGELPEAELPPLRVPSEGPPNPQSWKNRDEAAHLRWITVRPKLQELARELNLPAENLLSPDIQRRMLWQPPDDASTAGVDQALAELGARPWQRDLVAEPLSGWLGELG